MPLYMVQMWAGQRLAGKYETLKQLESDLKDPANARWAVGIQEAIYITNAEIREIFEFQKMMRQCGAFDVIVEFLGRYR